MLSGGGYFILFLPFGVLGDEMPPILPFLCLCLKRFFVVWVNGGEIRDGLGRSSDRDCCVGDGGHHRLGHSREDIGSDGRSCCVFVAVILMPLCPR